MRTEQRSPMNFDSIHPSHPRPQAMHEMRAQVAKLILAAGHRRVLDLPAGTGELTQMLRDCGLDVVAADVSLDAFGALGSPCARSDLKAPLLSEGTWFCALSLVEGI